MNTVTRARGWILSLLLIVAGCATVPLADSARDAAAKTFSPPAGKALIYVVRTGGSISGMSPLYRVYMDGHDWGQLADRTYFVFPVAPGRHSLLATAPGRPSPSATVGSLDTLDVDAASGNVYVVGLTSRKGGADPWSSEGAPVGLSMLPADEGIHAVRGTKLAAPLSPVTDAPEQAGEVRITPFQWAPGTTLSYTMHVFVQRTAESSGAQHTTDQRFTVKMYGVSTAKDKLTRVRIALDDLDYAESFFDKAGALQRTSILSTAADPKGAATRGAWRYPLVERRADAALTLNARLTSRVPIAALWGALLRPKAPPEPEGQLALTYTGQKLVDGFRVDAFRSVVTPAADVTYVSNIANQPAIEVQVVRGDFVEWRDATRGHRVRYYEALTLAVRGPRERISMTRIVLMALDRRHSVGL